MCNKLKAKNESDGWQITAWLLKLDDGYLKKESKRLVKKGWKVEIREDNEGMIALWRVK